LQLPGTARLILRQDSSAAGARVFTGVDSGITLEASGRARLSTQHHERVSRYLSEPATAPTAASGSRKKGSATMAQNLNQPVTDDSIKVRQLSHYQFSWVAGDPGQPGSWTLQLVLDQGAWEEVLTIDADDADNLQDLLSSAETVYYDVQRRTLMFGTTEAGHH
jgi:hypothetical protein